MTSPGVRPADLQALLDGLAAGGSRDSGPLTALRERMRGLAHQHLAAQDPLRALMDSEDLTQDTLLDLIAQVGSFRGSTWREFFAFVTALMERRIALAGRRARAGNRDLGRVDPWPKSDPAHAHGSPSTAAARHEDHARLEQLMATLPESLQHALRLRLAGQEYEALAKTLGISPANARQRVSRALQALRKKW